MKTKFIKLHRILSTQFGLDLRRYFCSLRGIPAYLRDWIAFRKGYTGKIKLMPCLHDRYDEGGTTKSEYFWQDLYVAQKIFSANPAQHIDIGSRIDGFVAHIASFRTIKVFDIRPITTNVPGIEFITADLMDSNRSLVNSCDSISCLHALEHFGLGRYGDPIDPIGYMVGLRNISSFLCDRGLFYLSVPIGEERVEFNAHRVFNPFTILTEASQCNLNLESFAWVNSDGVLTESITTESDLRFLCTQQYSLGIFTFRKRYV